MTNVKSRGTRVAGYSCDAYTTYGIKKPEVTFECEKLLDKPEELAKLSGEVKTYKKGEEMNV